MNKYQDIHYRHSVRKFSANLPSIKIQASTQISLNLPDIDETLLQAETQKPEKNQNPSIFSSSSSLITNSLSFQGKSSISTFSLKQNEKLNLNLAVNKQEIEKFDFFPSLSTKHALLSDKDFSRLMENINNITNPKTTNQAILINENEGIEAGIEEGQVKYFRVIVKQKKNPLTIKIYRKTGKIIIYTSSTCYEPGVKNYEKCFESDLIEIRDKGTAFNYEFLYLGVKAIKQSFIKIKISFGKKFKKLEEVKRIKRELSNDLASNLSPEQNFEDDKNSCFSVKKLKNCKDFIVKNKILNSKKFFAKDLNFKNQAISWKTKREAVLEKKKMIMELKKHKTLDSIRRKFMKSETERVKDSELLVKAEKNKFDAEWIKILYFFRVFTEIQERIRKEKSKKLRRLSLNFKALQIQKKFKNKFDITGLALIRSRNGLLLYHTTSSLLRKFEYNAKLVSSISESFSSKLVCLKFFKFCSAVPLIQKEFRNYLAVKQKRFEEFVKLWNKACEDFLANKKSKKIRKQKISKTLKKISSSLGNIFRDYYRSCLLKFESHQLAQTTSAVVKKSSGLLFSPTNEDLKQLIENALKLTK